MHAISKVLLVIFWFIIFSEFVPYVFQLLSLFLEFQDSPVPDHYMVLFPCLLTPMLWERLGNIPALSRLLQAYLAKGAQQIIAANKLVRLWNKCSFFSSPEWDKKILAFVIHKHTLLNTYILYLTNVHAYLNLKTHNYSTFYKF